MSKQEDFQNRVLAQLLSERGVPSDYEQRAGRRRMDVVSDVEGLRVVLEAETGFGRKAQAIKDADARLRQGLATIAFAVCYPDDVTESNLADATLTWTVRVKAGEPPGEWSTGGVTQLAQAVQQAPRSLSGADLAARVLSDGLDEVVGKLKTPVRRELARALDLPRTKRTGGSQSDGYFVAAKRGMLVVATAMLFHHRVQGHLPSQSPDGYDGDSKAELAIKNREKEVLETISSGTVSFLHSSGGDLVAAESEHAAARLHSSGGAFTVLAAKMLKNDAGTLALVLPSVVPTAPGNLALRRYMAQKFHIDTIVSSHDPSRIFFSENTSIGEVLLVCRRWRGDGPKPPTRVVNLARNPATPVEALDTAARIERAGGKGGRNARDFTVQEVDSSRIERGDWSAVNFLSPFLVEAYRTLSETDPGAVPMVPLSDLADIGPAGQRIRDAYTHSEMPTPLGRRALWHHKTDVTQSMRAETDVYIEPKPARRHLADKYWEQRSDLILPHRLRLNVARVAAVMLPERAVGSIWTPCRPHDPDIAKALCLYLNSTPGLLSLLGARDNRVPSYPSFSLDTLRSLPAPDFAALGAAERDLLRCWFDWLRGEVLQPFPQMHDDPVRQQIDDAVVKALGLDQEWVATIRRELAREPSVTDVGGPR